MRPAILDRVLGGLFRTVQIKSTPIFPISDANPILKKMFGLGDESDSLASPYSQIPIIYAAVRAVEKVLAMTPWKLLRGEREVDERDPMYRLWAMPNPHQSPDDMRTMLASNLQLKGNAYVVKSVDEREGLPAALYAWPATYFRAKYNDAGQWIGWTLKRGKEPPTFLPIERVIHISTFNPTDELLGLAPLDVLKQSYSALWEAVVYNRKFFKNDGTPPIIYKIKQGFPNRAQRDQFFAGLKRRRGAKEAHSAQVLEGDVDTAVVGFTQKDMQFLELVKYFSDDALMVFGVTKTQVSKYEDVNYATALSQDKVFITTTCIPMMRKIESKINSQWLRGLGYTLRFDERSNPALTYIASDEAGKIQTLVGGPVMTVNEGRRQLGLEPVPWGDGQPGSMDLVTPTLAPAPVSREAPAVPVADPALEDEMAKAQRTNTWHALNARIAPQVKKAEFELRKYFHAIEIRALAMAQAKAKDPDVAKSLREQDVDMLFDEAKLQRIVEKHLKAGLALGAGTLDVSINLDNPEVLQFLGSRVQYMKSVTADAKEKLRETLTRVLREAIEQQMTEVQRTAAIADALKQDFAAIKGRARSIARTEVHSAFSDGRWQGAQELHPETIEWISSRDALVRDAHRKLDGKKVPFGEKFSAWGFNGKRPLDPEAGAAQVINCYLPGTAVEGLIVGASKAIYAGRIREIVTAGGKRLSVTINHPILTREGWIAAGNLDKGIDLVAYTHDRRSLALRYPDDENNPMPIEDIFNALAAYRTGQSVVVVALDFHGDGGSMKNGKIDVVRTNGILPFDGEFVIRTENGEDLHLIEPGTAFSLIASDGTPEKSVTRIIATPTRHPSFMQLSPYNRAVVFDFGPFEALGIGAASKIYTGLGHVSKKTGAGNSGFLAQLFGSFAGQIAFDEIVEISEADYSGHVYDLQAIDGYIMSNGIVSSNCRCTFRLDFMEKPATSPAEENDETT